MGVTNSQGHRILTEEQLLDLRLRMRANMKNWAASGKLDAMKLKGKTAKGLLDHMAAKRWVVCDPWGKPFAFDNLREWARQNKGLFVDSHPEAKLPQELRIATGISSLLCKHEKSNAASSYRGWVGISKADLEKNTPEPPVEQPVAQPPPRVTWSVLSISPSLVQLPSLAQE